MVLALGILWGASVASDRLCKPFQCVEQLLKQLMGDTSPEGAGKKVGGDDRSAWASENPSFVG